MDRVHGVVHGPGPYGGPWTPVHVLYTSHSRFQSHSIDISFAFHFRCSVNLFASSFIFGCTSPALFWNLESFSVEER